MAIGQRLKLRLFLEGVEIPVISAAIQSQKNSPAAASLQIPANDYALDLRPRTLVHLFCYDIYNGAPPESVVSVGGPGIRTPGKGPGVDPDKSGIVPAESAAPVKDETLEDLENANYRLIFGGEMIGVSFSKSPTSRSIVLQCLDWSSYWDVAFQYQLSGFSLGGGGIRASFSGAATTVFNDFLEGSGDIILQKLKQPPRSYPNLANTLLGGIMHMIEAIGGIYFGKNAIRGVNDFFSLAEIRLHLTQMVGANPYPAKDELKLLRANGFGSLFKRSLAGLGKLVSIRQIFQALQRYIFHEIVPITAPRYVPSLVDPNKGIIEDAALSGDPDTLPLAKAATIIKQRAEELKQRQGRSLDSVTARKQSDLRKGLFAEVRGYVKTCRDAEVNARKVGIRLGQDTRLSAGFGLPDVAKAFADAGTKFNLVLEATRQTSRPGANSYQLFPAGTQSASEVNNLLTSIIEQMKLVLESKHRKKVKRATSQPDPPARLLTQLYRPDVWMVSPPRCNVIFPELYSQFSYSRNYMNEVTRLLLRTHDVFLGSDFLFDGYFISPSNLKGARSNRPIGRGRIGKDPDLADSAAWVVRDLMDHELYTGILPTFERMSELNLHAIRGGYANIDGVKVPYAQLAANHIFFQYRFRTRDLQLSGRFNPYCVLGFPMLVIDKYLSQDHLKDGAYDAAIAASVVEAIREGTGDGLYSPERQSIIEMDAAKISETVADVLAKRPNTHYLGTPELIAHNINASSGGTTQVQMGYARTTNEKSEFLGAQSAAGAKARRTRNIKAKSIVAALRPPVVGGRGFRAGKITNVVDITDRYMKRSTKGRFTDRTSTGMDKFIGGTQLPLFVPDRTPGKGIPRKGSRVVVGVEQPAASYGPEVQALVGTGGTVDGFGGSSVLVTFKAYEITEELGVYEAENTEVPPEKLTFPPWYGDHYKSEQIGGLYSYFFGTGAITDPLSVILPGTNPKSSSSLPADAGAGDLSGLGNASPDRTATILVTKLRSEFMKAASDSQLANLDLRPSAGDSALPAASGGGQVGPAGEPGDSQLLGSIEERSPISEATEEIVRAYSQIKLQHFDVQEFIRAYTWRPIATLVDLFGTSNLEISDKGEVVQGVEGFHSRAFGNFDDLRQIVTSGAGKPKSILGLSVVADDSLEISPKAQHDADIAARLDTRKEKRLHVLRYLYSVLAQRGIAG